MSAAGNGGRPNREQIALNIMALSNLDNTGPRRQTLLDDPKFLPVVGARSQRAVLVHATG